MDFSIQKFNLSNVATIFVIHLVFHDISQTCSSENFYSVSIRISQSS